MNTKSRVRSREGEADADLGKKIEGGFMCRPPTVKLAQYN